MYYTALINDTTHEIVITDDPVESREDALHRARMLGMQAELNEAGINPDVPMGDKWHAYFGEAPFEFPPEPAPAEEEDPDA